MVRIVLLCIILTLKHISCVHGQEIYSKKEYVNNDNGIASKLREESLELSLHEAEFQLKTLKEKELERILQEKELLKTLQERESKIQTLETEMTALEANYTDDFLQRVCSVHPTTVFAHPVECQLYYNCSYSHDFFLNLDTQVPYRSVYLSECDYPLVFSTKTLKCESDTVTECDGRILRKWECGYYKLKFSTFPCRRMYPNCEGKSDGLWPNTVYYSEGTSVRIYYYMRCKDERTIGGGSCAYDKIWLTGGGYRFLHDQECKSTFEIPIEDGGYLPSCNSTEDGNYRFPTTCEGYYKCENGTSTAVKCPNYTSFDITSKVCTPFSNC